MPRYVKILETDVHSRVADTLAQWTDVDELGLGGGGITNSAPANTIPVTTDEDGNLGGGDQSIGRTTYEGSQAWYLNNDGDGQETLVSQHNLIVASKDSLKLRTGVDADGAASAGMSIVTNYLNQDLDGSFSVVVRPRTHGGGGNITFETASGMGAGDNNGGEYRITLGGATGSGVPGQFIIDNLPASNPGILGALWNDGGTLKISAG